MSGTDKWIGKEMPHVKLGSSRGGDLKLPEDLNGKWTVLYFYPKDDTPGCTKQACAYRDAISDFEKIGVRVFGVSGDDLNSHESFASKFKLNFPLLSDTKNQLSTSLGVYGEQEWKGQKHMGLSRDTFLIDPKGIVRQVWRKVNPETTMGETFDAVKQFMSKH